THVCFDNPYPDPKSGGLPMRTTLLSLGAIATLVAPLLGGAPADGTDPEWPEETDGVVVFDRDTEGFQCFRIPAIVEAPDGSLIAFAEARRPLGDSFCHDDGSIDLVMRSSNDGGRTWSELQTVLAGDPWGRDRGATRGNPVPIVINQGAHAGRIVLLSTWN